MERAAIAGVGMTDVGVFPGRTYHELALEAIVSALSDAGTGTGDIQAVVTTPTGYAADVQKFLAPKMAEYLGISARVMFEIDCGGASSLLALKQLANEIGMGRIDVGLVYASHWELTPREMAESFKDNLHLLRLANSLYGSYDSRFGMLSPIAYYAMSSQRYMYEYDITPEMVAALPVVLRDNAGMNPRAMYRDPITVQDVLDSTMLSPPIHLLESCPISHGAAAVVLASEEWAGTNCDRPVLIAGVGESHDDSHFIPSHRSISSFPVIRESTRMALDEAGRSISDVDVAEVYGAFAAVECIAYEEMGFFERGGAPRAVAEGLTRTDGEFPINTSGGRLSLGHAAYATPLFEVFEVVSQLRGECGGRQVGDPSVGLVQAEHGMNNGSAVMILERGW